MKSSKREVQYTYIGSDVCDLDFWVTGTNGKTTTAYMTADILKRSGKECALIGTVTHKIGNKTYEAINTTPGKETLREYIKEAETQNIDTMVMEVSSHALSQGQGGRCTDKIRSFYEFDARSSRLP